MNIIIGIDPGITGAFAVLEAETLNLLDVQDLPTLTQNKKQKINGVRLTNQLLQWKNTDHSVAMCYLENVHAMPKQGVTSMFNMGRNLGVIEGVIGALSLPITHVPPVVWKRRARLIKKEKDESRTRAIELYPEAPLARKKDHNRAEAILIARFGGQP